MDETDRASIGSGRLFNCVVALAFVGIGSVPVNPTRPELGPSFFVVLEPHDLPEAITGGIVVRIKCLLADRAAMAVKFSGR
jgi:hypothetical protein